MKKILSIILTVAFVISSVGISAFATDYESHWAEDIINEFVEAKIISGDSNGKINPDKNIKRAEFVKIINKYYGYAKKATDNFSDINASSWYAEEFLIAKAQGYITGDGMGNANPENYITRAEVCVILARLLNLGINTTITAPDAYLVPEWAKGYVGAAVKAGYIKGYSDGSLKITNNITRAEAISLISRTEKEETPEENKPAENLGNVSVMTNTSGGGGGGGGGGGSAGLAPTGTLPARIDIRNFDNETYVLELTAQYIRDFIFKIIVDNQEYTYAGTDISPAVVSGGYKFETESIIFKTVMARGINGEKYTVFVKGIAEAGKADTDFIQVFSDTVTIPLPSPEGLKAAYAPLDAGGYDSDKYLLEWNIVDSASEYTYELYNSKEEGATAVASGVVLKSQLPEGAQTVSQIIDMDSAWGTRDNLYFTVSAKNERTGIYSLPSEAKELLLDAPAVDDVVYLSNDEYKVEYIKDSAATSYEVSIAGNMLGVDDIYTATDGDVNLEVGIKAFYPDNETKTGKYEFCFGYAGGNGADEPFVIENERHFNNISAYKNASYILNNDITLSESYSPIALFSGSLDGAGKKITIGSVGTPATQGVFAVLGNGAKIENLVINGQILSADHAGALAGVIENSGSVTVKNCINLADVLSTASNKRVGGFIGSGYDGDTTKLLVENCVNYGSVTCGGSNAAAGGIVGIVKGTTIKDCANYGIINGPNRAGGIIGYSAYGSFTVSGCANFGSILSSNTPVNAGGIVGHMQNTSSCFITDCYNGGTAYSGIAAILVGATVSNCVNTGTVTNAIADAETSGNYCLEGSYINLGGATEKTSSELKTLELEGYAPDENYEYPLPENITYMTESDYNSVIIASAEDFLNITNDLGGSYKLACDITLPSDYISIAGFIGILNGNGYTITTGTEESPASQGIFASIGNGAVIKNLTVDGYISATSHAGAFAGIPAGTGVNVEFNKCVNRADVTGTGVRTGGFMGEVYTNMASVKFIDCVNYGNITASGNVPVGGFAGLTANATFKDCVNYGKISGGNRTGGLAGWTYLVINISGCANFGEVSGGTGVLGGIVGFLQDAAATNGSISGCYNAGTVKNGIAGSYGANITRVTITDCINTGTVQNAITNKDFSGNYYLEGSAVNAYGATVLTAEELKELILNGFEIKEGYDWPLPTGITYNPDESGI